MLLEFLKNIIFSEEKKFDSQISFLGLYNSKRVYYYADEKNFALPDHFYKYKVFIPKSNGSGAIGEVLSTPLIGEPLIGATETFLSIGGFETYTEASNCLKYIKTKFARALLGVLKITQDNTKEKWAKVPLFNFFGQFLILTGHSRYQTLTDSYMNILTSLQSTLPLLRLM